MPGSLGYEEKDAKTFASWVRMCGINVDMNKYMLITF